MADHANGTSNLDVLKNNAAAAYDTVANGPVAQNVMDQHAKATAELSNLAASRQTPANPAATGQPLTHYHSFFSELLSWNNPRASAIAYATIVSTIFALRYLNLLRYGFKVTWMALGITIAAEVAGKALMNNGFATQLRPRKYYTIPKETLDMLVGDVHELINFFVIESQRILFAENIYASAAAALGAFLSYYLIKIVPYWGLAVIATTVTFFAPLVYKTNKELIDGLLQQSTEVISTQTAQLRDVALKQTEQATQVTKQYVGDYTAKAQSLIGNARPEHKDVSHKDVSHKEPHGVQLKEDAFPAAPKELYPEVPKQDFTAEPAVKADEEPLIST